jgi:hypothetical protein
MVFRLPVKIFLLPKIPSKNSADKLVKPMNFCYRMDLSIYILSQASLRKETLREILE